MNQSVNSLTWLGKYFQRKYYDCVLYVLTVVFMTWIIPISVFFTSIIGWQYFVGRRTVQPGKCYVQYMEDALFNCILQVRVPR
jgi:hypothetical protein